MWVRRDVVIWTDIGAWCAAWLLSELRGEALSQLCGGWMDGWDALWLVLL